MDTERYERVGQVAAGRTVGTAERVRAVFTASAISLALLTTATGCKRDPNVEKHKYLESGKRYEGEEKYKEAAIQFSNALKVDHNFSDAHYELAKTYLKMGNAMAGYHELSRTVDLAPTNIQARIDLGNLLVAGAAPDRAMDQAKAVLTANPENADALALRSNIEQKKGDLPAALADIQHALAIDPNRSNFHTALALIENATSKDNKPQVQQELQKAVSLDPKNTSAQLLLASLLESSGDRQGAEQQDIAAIKSNPKDLKARASLAGVYMRAGDKPKVEETLRQAAEDLNDNDDGAQLLKEYYQRTGQIDRAEPAYAELTSKYPKSVPLKIAYAQILLEKQSFDKATSVVADLSKTNGNNPQVEVLNTMLLMKAGKTNDAFTLLQKGTKNAPDNVRLRLLLARVAEVKGDMSVAEASFREAARLEPGNVEAQSGIASIASHKGDWTLLAQVADSTIQLHPKYSDAYLWRGTAEANQKQYEPAQADFHTALQLNPSSAIALTELGQLSIREQHVPEGKALLEQALAKDPNSLKALNLLVELDLIAKQPAKAVALVQDQIAKVPNSAPLYSDLARLQLATHDFAGARDSAKKAMQIDPANEDVVQSYSQAEVSLGETDQAIATWQQWLGSHPRDPRALVLLGTLSEAKGDANKAMDYYKKTLEIVPGQPMASNNLAYLMVENGQNVDAALTLAQTARRSMPDSPSTADTLAWVYYHKGTYSSARDLLEDALKVDPNNASMHYHLGMVYGKLGNKTDAQTQLKKAASLAPNTQTAKDANAALSGLA